MALTSTQIGSLAENLVANEIMIESDGRLSPFQPIADDDGIDVLIYDKKSGKSAPLQIKARTSTINKPGKQERGNTVHFEHRKATLNIERNSFLLCVLLGESLRTTERAWLIPLRDVPHIASERKDKYVIRANKQATTNDKFKKYQCKNMAAVTAKLYEYFADAT
jgi:hypothetical protein